MTPLDVASVTALRANLWTAGYRPVPIYNPDAPGESPGKRPLGLQWQLHARMDPPFCAASTAVAHALNTGILTDGKRAIDLDVDDPQKAIALRELAADMLGHALIRIRATSPRALLLYRAAEGEPPKLTLTGSSHTKDHGCKVEVLGRGQQFVAFGRHYPSGADLQWFPAAPGDVPLAELTAVTETQIHAFLTAAAPIIDAPAPVWGNGHAANGFARGRDNGSPAEPQADIMRILPALAAIPNAGPADWEEWNRLGMAVWAATGGIDAGRDAFEDWSALNAAYDADATHERWDHYAKSPPTSIGAGTIFHVAAKHGWKDPRRPPPPQSPDDYGTTTTSPRRNPTNGDSAGDWTSQEEPDPKPERPHFDPAVAEFLSAITWANLEIKPERRLLGDFITSSTRIFLSGTTGIGKTMFLYGMAGGMASGQCFLHWTCDGPSKWLIIDGEMPQVLVKARSADLLRRSGPLLIPPHGVTIYSRDREDEFAKAFPHLGRMSPLNTEAGHTFVQDLIAAVRPDGVIFDNVMSLAPGNQKEEEPWAGCIPLVEFISRNGLAQIWADHTGHNSSRHYGTSTKTWRFDASAILTPLTGDDEPPPDHLAFKLSFEKARRRTPDNWQEFAPQVVRLVDDAWTVEPVDRSQAVGDDLPDNLGSLFDIIRNTLARFGGPQKVTEDGKELVAVQRQRARDRLITESWFPEGMVTDDKPTRAGMTAENNALTKLKRRHKIDFNRDWIWRPS